MRPYQQTKRLNRWLNWWELKIRQTRLRSRPRIAYVDPTNLCNLRCPVCVTGANISTYPKGLMSLETFQKVVDQLGPYLDQLHLYNRGEPLLNPQITEMIRYASRYGAEIRLNSNLNLSLSESQADELVTSGLDHLIASIDGATQERYEVYRVGGNLERALCNLEMVRKRRDALGRRLPRITWVYMVHRYNEEDISSARQMAERIGVRFRCRRIKLDIFKKGGIEETVREGEHWLPQQEKFNRYSPHKNKPPLSLCRSLWDEVSIQWDGGVAPCCRVFLQEDFFASQFGGKFDEIWNSETYQKARRIFKKGIEPDSPPVCRTCFRLGNIFR